jgi:hypothetical protein
MTMGWPRTFSAAAQRALALESREPPGEKTAYIFMGLSGYSAKAWLAERNNRPMVNRTVKTLQ